MKLDPFVKDDILAAASKGGYLGIGWAVVSIDADGKTVVNHNGKLKPGRIVVAENYYGYVFLGVSHDMTLFELEVE